LRIKWIPHGYLQAFFVTVSYLIITHHYAPVAVIIIFQTISQSEMQKGVKIFTVMNLADRYQCREAISGLTIMYRDYENIAYIQRKKPTPIDLNLSEMN
jgi:hypothetical protein